MNKWTPYLNQHAGHYLQIYSPNVLAGYIVGQAPMNDTGATPLALGIAK